MNEAERNIGLQHKAGSSNVTKLHAQTRASTSSIHGRSISDHQAFPCLALTQAIFFGANDACLPGSSTGQHVPLDEYKQNIRDIVQHPSITAQNPRLILITPPPVDEYKLEESGLVKRSTDPQRTAEHTKKYADACRQTGEELGVPVLDIWSIMMAEAGWKKGQPLVGSKKVSRNDVLDHLLVDGELNSGLAFFSHMLIVI